VILPIIQAPDPRLLEPSHSVQVLSARLGHLFGALIDTRIKANGVGLSAVQIGVHLRVATVDPARFGGFRLLINPVITSLDGNFFESLDGCLSIGHGVPRFKVRRARGVLIKFLDLNAEEQILGIMNPFAAAVLQHEIDHMDGKLIA
jgi:peptide deformylase